MYDTVIVACIYYKNRNTLRRLTMTDAEGSRNTALPVFFRLMCGTLVLFAVLVYVLNSDLARRTLLMFHGGLLDWGLLFLWLARETDLSNNAARSIFSLLHVCCSSIAPPDLC